MKILRKKKLMAKVFKILKKTSKMEFISVKLQGYSVQAAHLI